MPFLVHILVLFIFPHIFRHPFQAGCVTYPVSYPMRSRGSFPGDKAAVACIFSLTST